jgi:autotransporter adhesin
MNKVYKSVWNASAGTYVAAAENVNASGRKSSRRARNLASAALASAATFGSIGFAHAADSGAAAPLADTGLSSANPAAPLLASSVGAASSSSSVASAGVVVQDARASTAYESNNLKYFHVNSTLADSWVNGNDAISIGGGARANSTSTNGVIYVSDRASTGSGPVAIGAAAFAQGAGNVALGMNAQADGLYHAVALGGESQAHNPYALAAGGRSIAAAESSTALGGHAEAQAVQSVALGYESIATRANTVSVGKEGAERQLTNLAAGTVDTDAVNLKQMNTAVQSALASGNPNDAVRYDSSLHTAVTLGGAGAVQPVKLTNIAPGQLAANSKDAVNGSQLYATANSIAGALGGGSKVNSDGTVTAPALTISGTTYNDVASAMNAIGVATRDVQNTAKYVKVVSNAAEALSLGSETTAIGGGSFAAGSRSLALGAGARAQFDDSVAIGSGAQTYEANTVSVGHSGAEKRITNLAAGVNSTDAATVGQLNTLQQLLTKPAQNTVLKSSALLGANLAAAAAPVTDFIAVSVNTTPGPATHVSDANNAMAIGPTSAATGGNALAVGAGSGALRTGSTAVGAGTAGLAINATVVGLFATTGYDAQNGVAVGYMAASEGADTVTIGTYAVANADSSLSLGMRASTARGADNSVALGNGAKTSAAGAIALGANSVGDRANTVSVGNSTLQRQIVNVAAGTSKNDAVNVDQLKGVTASLGGGADVGADGAVKRPSYTVGGQTYTDVGSAINAAALSGAGAVDAVKYDTTAHDKVTLGGTGARAAVKLGNLAEGRADSDAVNVKQLKDLGAGIDTSGNVTSAFVAYDDSTKTRVTFGGKSSTTPVTLANVAEGKANTDAVNVKQLKDLGAGIDTSGNVTSAFVAYDDSAKTRVTFGGKSSTTPVTLANVADGKANNDAVNVKQLKDLGASFDPSGNVTSAFVAYDDSTLQRVTLKGSGGTKLANVAAGTLAAGSMEAVNGAQLYKTNQDVANVAGDVTNLTNVVNNITVDGGGVKYFHAKSAALDSAASGDESVAIGGAASATAKGAVALGAGALAERTDTVSVGAKGKERQIVNVASGTLDTDAVNLKQLKDLGASFDTSGNVTGAFVAYDDSAKTRVTLGSTGSTTPVTLANVAEGKANTDAVNVKQLKDLGAGIDTSGNVTSAFVAYDDSAKTRVTFGGKSSTTPVTLANVADGKANNDAVNVKQLKDLGASIDTSGNVTSAFVAYDDATRATVTLKGTDGTRITRVAAGTLSATSSDAVNGAQLYKTNQDVANVSGDVTNLTSVVNNITNGAGIKYFTAASTLDAAQATGSEAIAIGGNARATAANSVALGANATTTANLGASAYQPGALDLAGATPVGEVSFGSVGSERRLTNVAAGAAGTDAVNVSQLKSAVAAGTAASLANAVQYDNTAHDSVTLGGGGALVPVALKNVAPGQLAAGSRDAVNGAQLFNTASSAAAALGGGAVAGSDGKIKAPTYTISDKTYNDVGSALAAVGHTVDTINHDVSSATKFISVRSDPFDANVAEALASGQGGVAIGSATYAYGDQSLALGPGARTSGFGSVALGAGAKASEEGGIALGTHAVSLFANSVAIGYNAEADQQNTVSVGNANEQRRITHVADGVTATDAATVGQLDALKNQLSKSGGGGLRSMALLAAPAATPVTDYIAVSTKVTAGTTGTHTSNDENAMAVGPMAAATGKNALAVGAGAGALRTESTAFGAGAAALSNGSTVVGNMASTGYDATASVAVGYMAAVEGDHTVALGMKATANGAYSLAVGANATTAWSAANSIALGGNSLADRANTISVGNASLQRQIVNVAAGSGNFDAVNVTQLNGVLGALGGKAGLDANGAVQKPAYQIGGNSYSDVGSALAAVAELGGSGAVDAVKYDTSAHDMLTLGGVGAAVPVALTNLAAGTVSATSRDAINGAQLYGTAHSIATALGGGAAVDADGKLGKPAYKIGENSYDSVGNAFSAVNSALASGGDPNAVVYDSTARDRVTLNAGNAAVTLSNVAAAKADSDAVNLGQLKAAGLAVDPGSGLVTNAFVAYDNTSKTSVTFNAGSSPTQLKNVADGVDQYDAVNVRQMQQYVTNQINHLPTPSPVVVNDLPTGTASGDAIAIGNGSVASGAAAIAIGARTVTAGDNSVALGVQASAPAQNAVALGANSVADRDNTVSVGSAGAERQITNVAAGTAPTDAVNLNQLNSAVSGLQKNLHDMDRDNRRGIAAASALNIVTPYLPGRTTLNAGVAGYRGTAALGLGVSRWNEKGTVNYNLGVSSAGGNSTIVRAGVGIVFGN